MPYIDSQGNYYEGDKQPGDTEVTQRPTDCYQWSNGTWVLNSDLYKHRQRLEIDAKYDVIRANLTTAYMSALQLGDTAQCAKIAAKKVELLAAHKAEKEAVNNG